ncbi:hypothetical protein TcasGA2_TC034380 [Tribolium castaneum]|uniref:Uncharacterized protein n=1 Tax=Tribolium castaneum TaxID=7070 RepID=A0A139WBC3_TRICA|nr:hypothetical protein TcasGA2_TC034380 [Tribolium castaneum]
MGVSGNNTENTYFKTLIITTFLILHTEVTHPRALERAINKTNATPFLGLARRGFTNRSKLGVFRVA